jgi:hypothetical protein
MQTVLIYAEFMQEVVLVFDNAMYFPVESTGGGRQVFTWASVQAPQDFSPVS